ncbi:MAG: endonuclease/exonuclease/phosphatase family protein [Woeseiaceae bacterium]
MTPRPYLTTAEKVTRASVLAATAVTLLSFLGQVLWVAELSTHFRMQLVVGSIVLCILAAVFRQPRSALLAAVLAAVNLAYLMSYVMPGPRDAQATPVSFRMLAANVNLRNNNYGPLRDLIADLRPDIVGLSEVDREWAEALRELDYPYRILHTEDGAYGLALFSRLPLRELEHSPYRQDGFQTAILAEVEIGGRGATFVLAHVRAPTSPAKTRLRNRQLEKLATLFRADRNHDEILLGDLNVTPWSPYYDVLESGTGIVNAARGIGYRPTWPTRPAFLRIPIDHCLLSEGLNVASIRTGPDIGSDHLPLIVDISVATH